MAAFVADVDEDVVDVVEVELVFFFELPQPTASSAAIRTSPTVVKRRIASP